MEIRSISAERLWTAVRPEQDGALPRQERQEAVRSAEAPDTAERLRQKRTALQNQVLLLESSADSASLSAETLTRLRAQIKEVSAALKTAEGQERGGGAVSRRARFDSYERGLPAESFGYYSVEPAEEEGYRVSFRPYANPAEEGAPEAAPDGADTMTADTDKVDQEIRQLRKEREALERELRQAQSGEDGQAIQELKRRIAAADRELGAKDNDAYRKTHAVYTQGA